MCSDDNGKKIIADVADIHSSYVLKTMTTMDYYGQFKKNTTSAAERHAIHFDIILLCFS